MANLLEIQAMDKRTRRRIQLLMAIGGVAAIVTLGIFFFENYTTIPRSDRLGTLDQLHEMLQTTNVASLELEEVSESLWRYDVTLLKPVDGRMSLEVVAPMTEETESLVQQAGVVPTFRTRNTFFPILAAQAIPVAIIFALITFIVLRLGSPRPH